MSEQHPKTTRRKLCCEKLVLNVMMLKALPLAHFSSALLLEWQITIISVKNIKRACEISTKSIDF